jgi:hypothetical protein
MTSPAGGAAARARAWPSGARCAAPRRVQTLLDFPADVVVAVLLLLPLDTRLLLRGVCASWRAWLRAEPRVWALCDLTARMHDAAANDALLAAAVAAAVAARAPCICVDVSNKRGVSVAGVLAAAAAAGGALSHLRAACADSQWSQPQLAQLAALAPALRAVTVDLRVDCGAAAVAVLQWRGPPFAALSVRTLHISPPEAARAQEGAEC